MFNKIFRIYGPTVFVIFVGFFAITLGIIYDAPDPDKDMIEITGILENYYFEKDRMGNNSNLVLKLVEYKNEFNDFHTTEGDIKDHFKEDYFYIKFHIAKKDISLLNGKSRIKTYGLTVNNSEILSARWAIAHDNFANLLLFPLGIGMIISGYFVFKKDRKRYSKIK